MAKQKVYKDLEKLASREKRFSTLAKQEGKGAALRAKSEAKAGLKASAKDSRMEHTIDNLFAQKRSKIATAAKKQLAKVK